MTASVWRGRDVIDGLFRAGWRGGGGEVEGRRSYMEEDSRSHSLSRPVRLVGSRSPEKLKKSRSGSEFLRNEEV